ncbi:hypothetical protein JX265_009932 [Neoarthrinium moseri]|uniref:TeaA receptor TeaR n=1 Tax=Neoarthrinium moseri TaxID=1658444 RepID=A0A9P9WFK3_9PEZI|nr:hypothetical protein JX266_012341 [Neoarthrinium moseri]KAI1860533.1 hypothetical protein JX265_009932 [Neoarthrinium moseri]
MAAMSSSAPGATVLDPPPSAYGNDAAWKSSYALEYQDDPMHDRSFMSNHDKTNGVATPNGNAHVDPFAKRDPAEPFPATKEGRSGGRSASRSTSRPGSRRANSHNDADKTPVDNAKWIHRDKLARIESEELQAAGIILPKPRSQSRPRRERSSEKMHSRRATDASEREPLPRSRKNSTNRSASAERSPDVETPTWDLRMPEEIAEDPDEYWISADTLGANGSRLPVAKQSPAPVPADYLDRDAPVPRKMSGTLQPDDDFLLSVSKPRERSGSTPALDHAPPLQPGRRSATDGSPKKSTTNGSRKPSTNSSKTATSTGRPKTRSGPGKDSGTTTRPTTRSGELSSPKAPEGDPPWMINAYKPDPRLPPDQQLLPTVARRLAQEKWEKEGKFGSVYDKEFRPLTDEGFGSPPELQRPQLDDKESHDEWPLRADAKSPTPSRPGTSSYSTMPKMRDTPLASPRMPMAQPQPQQQPTQITRVPTAPEQPPMPEKTDQPEPAKKKGGCGCCVVM